MRIRRAQRANLFCSRLHGDPNLPRVCVYPAAKPRSGCVMFDACLRHPSEAPWARWGEWRKERRGINRPRLVFEYKRYVTTGWYLFPSRRYIRRRFRVFVEKIDRGRSLSYLTRALRQSLGRVVIRGLIESRLPIVGLVCIALYTRVDVYN